MHNLLAIRAVFLLDFREALKLLNQALVFYRDNEFRRDEAVCLEYLALGEYYTGDYEKAKEYLSQVLKMKEPSVAAIAQTRRILTDVFIATQDFEKAAESATLAEEAITAACEGIEEGAIYRSWAQIHDYNGDPDTAASYYARSAEKLRQLGARYELAMTHLVASRARCFDEQTQLHHLRQAKVLFVEMKVPKRVRQIESSIEGFVTDRKRVGKLLATKHGALAALRASAAKGTVKKDTLITSVFPKDKMTEVLQELVYCDLVDVSDDVISATPRGRNIISKLEAVRLSTGN
jgi:tetratricopeptide (TPR) repeat protein